MKISCIIPCYNAGGTIARAIESVLNQTLPVEEIIIVDDGSDLSTKSTLTQLEKTHKLVSVFTQVNKGVCAARNKAIALSKGDYILTLDADDTFEPSFVIKAFNRISNEGKIGFVVSGYNVMTAGKVASSQIPSGGALSDFLCRNGAIACGLFSKKALLEIGGYDEQFNVGYEDWDLNIALLKAGYSIEVIPEYLYNYIHLENSRNKRALRKDAQIRKIIFQKYKTEIIEHLDDVYGYLLNERTNLRQQVVKERSRLDFKLGEALLRPIRFLKKLLL